jgi:hypothetical protein
MTKNLRFSIGKDVIAAYRARTEELEIVCDPFAKSDIAEKQRKRMDEYTDYLLMRLKKQASLGVHDEES